MQPAPAVAIGSLAEPKRWRLYVSATPDAEPLRPLWRLHQGRTLFAGTLDRNASHQHGAPVYLAGLCGSFRLRIRENPWQSCRAALIPAGVPHELDLAGEPVSVLYIEPTVGNAHALAPLVGNAIEVGGALVGATGETGLMRELYEDRASLNWVDAAITDLVDFSQTRARRTLDARVSRAISVLESAEPDTLVSVTNAAQAAGLSVSRLQHLFSEEMGVSFRRYRAWVRMLRAIDEIAAGSSFTEAAHAAGFADQSHFAHDFRKTFGAPASRSLTNVRV
ncbi:AraC family transcriptional regulator [Hyphomicrobium methylovorum]|nr:AraC family transcriptional regulator [Hyphomicrobium methylovorum]